MALPVYRKQGIMYADLPRIETADLQAQAESFSTINKRLDQLMAFADEQGTKQAKEAAIKYATQNPVTEQQIQQAKDNEVQPVTGYNDGYNYPNRPRYPPVISPPVHPGYPAIPGGPGVPVQLPAAPIMSPRR